MVVGDHQLHSRESTGDQGRKKASQPAPSSVVARSSPRISRWPSELTPTAYTTSVDATLIFGWGESLHFAPLSPQESLEESKIRHQRLMISKLELREGMTVVDVGCGIGGPMRRVVREAGVRVLGAC